MNDEEAAALARRLARSRFRARMRGELDGDGMDAAHAAFLEDWRPVLDAIADRDRADEADEPGVAGAVNI